MVMRCEEEEETADHVVFWCRKIMMVKDEKGSREWVREEGMRWDSWDALASRKWVRMEDRSRVDDEGRPVLEKVDLMEIFFANIPRQIKSCISFCLIFLWRVEGIFAFSSFSVRGLTCTRVMTFFLKKQQKKLHLVRN